MCSPQETNGRFIPEFKKKLSYIEEKESQEEKAIETRQDTRMLGL